MMNTFLSQFNSRYPVIGALHFGPLPGVEGHPGMDVLLEVALEDAEAMEKGGVDGIIVENNYDIPHKMRVNTETVEAMTSLTSRIRQRTNVPIGISVLWNDYEAAFRIASAVGGTFIRIPAFVDEVVSDYGRATPVSYEALAYRNKIGAENIGILADVQVKHATMADSDKPLSLSVLQAVQAGASGIIVTGQWTGDPPVINEIAAAQKAAGEIPVIVGSGATSENITQLRQYSDAVIVGTALKKGSNAAGETNVKSWTQRVDEELVRQLVQASKA